MIASSDYDEFIEFDRLIYKLSSKTQERISDIYNFSYIEFQMLLNNFMKDLEEKKAKSNQS